MVIAAAVLWSTSSVFIRALQQPTFLQIDEPALAPLHIAFYRSLFAGLAIIAFLRPRHLTWRPSMAGMVVAFGVMTALYISALARGSAANAILLQNTAPVWVYVLGVYFFGDLRDSRSLRAVVIGLAGAIVIVAGNWPRGLSPVEQSSQQEVLIMAVGSGFFYALVVLFLRHLRNESSAWLTVLNLLGGSLVIAAFAARTVGTNQFMTWLMQPTARQLLFIALYGIVQLAFAYMLFSQGLKSISPQEAGIITLIEPVLNPVWAYLIAPEKETPTVWTLAGGGLLLAALAWRYWPRRL